MKTLLLIDSNALIHRSFHALPAFTSTDGKPTGAIYGLSSILIKIFHENPPDYAIALFDRPEPTFRKKMYNDYKIHRPKAPDELVSQIIEAHNLFEKFGIKTYEIPGFEADDLIGSAALKFYKEKDLKIIILTGDLDALQLVKDDKVVVETLKKGISETIIYNEDAVIQRYGLLPKQLPDYKGLAGDQSDNIPGVKGVGPKTATEIIKEFSTLENFYEKNLSENNTPEKKRTLYKKLLDNKDIALLSKKLATIHIEAPLDLKNLAEIEYKKIPVENVIPYFKDMGFQSLIKRLSDKGKLPEKSSNTKQSQMSFIKHQPNITEKIAKEIEMPLSPILKQMEKWGIKVDQKILAQEKKRLDEQLKELTKQIYTQADIVFNINSPKQLLEILKGKFKLKITSTNYDKLNQFKDKIDFIDSILKYRELFKLKSTYVEPLTELSKKDSKIHATFVQLKAATGRITCENPNLQNIPNTIRQAFIAESGNKLVSFDYSQIELRILASITNDTKMITAFQKGSDIHQITASKVFNVPENEVTNDMRKVAKTLNFGIVYGMGSRTFAQETGLPLKDAKKFIDEYFKDFPEIKIWQEKTKEFARENGYLENLNGRVRPLPEIVSFNPGMRAETERMAINFPIQSVAADILKMSMVKIKDELEKNGYWNKKVKMLLTIHDELVFEIKDDKNLKKIINLINKTMESIYTLKVPLKVNIKIGDNWGEL
ncbi:hypothetical protein COV23_00320 [Candidatus Wolfebacteria bacterium CG10_big_fil_rev_8_21_14_0_10_31_9]|uniref:DNA-directed DNA polymerase n=1 Tax=Candidatus Wolfebacteria bacterium CG10_big_fil_rev_8_21_14_0_10_31_9 TaxID=1975070 RepID=A0A2H0RCS8_9BACT|nr:MAG: hypothetical protein COV23_00320 [Candidatus Wolfebacteria bacterium CG10_big_fil_rev_8_21_14_0_10_31_9]